MTTVMLLAAAAMAGEGDPNVLIKGNAVFHSQPHVTGQTFKPLPEFSQSNAPHLVVFAEIIERTEGWAHVRTAVHRQPCHEPLGKNLPSGLEFWVKADELVGVVTKPVEMTGAKGTKIYVNPGVAAYSNVDTSFLVAAKGITVRAMLPQDAIGWKFVPHRPPVSDFRPTHGGNGVFGDKDIVIKATNAPATPAGDAWTFHRRCLTATGPAVDAHQPVAGGATPDTRGGSARRTRSKATVQAGATLWWPNGTYAGTSEGLYRLFLDEQADPKGLICGPARPGLQLCIDDPEVEGELVKRHAVPKLEPTSSSEIKHPKGAVKGSSAKCRTEVDIDPKGKVVAVDAQQCPEEFEKATEEGVMSWTYPPHKVNGKAVHARTWTWVAFDKK